MIKDAWLMNVDYWEIKAFWFSASVEFYFLKAKKSVKGFVK